MTTAEQVVVPTVPPLARVGGVELMHTGQWAISTGVATFTVDDLAAAVAALDCPAVRRPVLKLGHTDPRFDGEPAVGWVDQLATAEGGHTLVGDYVGMPGWLGEVIASAYPDRSIEGVYDFRCQIGHVHPFVLTGVALLGVTPPGIGTLASLQDVAALYGVAAAHRPAGGTPVRATVRATGRGDRMPNPTPTTVAAGVTTEDVRRAYYDEAAWELWIEEFHLDPLQLIVINDHTGERSRVPVVVGEGDGEDAVSFGDPVRVVVRYEDVPPDAGVTATAAAARRITYASRAESRPGARPDRPAAAAPAAGNPTQEGSTAVAFTDDQLTTMRRTLGLPDGADEATIVQALGEAMTERADPAAPQLPEGTVVIEQATLNELQVAARRGVEAHDRQQREDRERLVDAAIRDGRIPPARREHWLAQLAADTGAADTLASLAPGLIPVGRAIGSDDSAPPRDETAEQRIQAGRDLYQRRHGAKTTATA